MEWGARVVSACSEGPGGDFLLAFTLLVAWVALLDGPSGHG